MIHKFLFFFLVIILAFIPGGFFVSIALVFLYYLPSILKSAVKEAINDSQETFENNYYPIMSQITTGTDKTLQKMNSYSDDTLEKMK